MASPPLKPGGVCVVSQCTGLTGDRPDEAVAASLHEEEAAFAASGQSFGRVFCILKPR